MVEVWLNGEKKYFNEVNVRKAYNAIKDICSSCPYSDIVNCGDQIMQDCAINIAKEAINDLMLLLKSRNSAS